MKTLIKVLIYVVLVSLYVLWMISIIPGSQNVVVSDYSTTKDMDQGSTVVVSYLNPEVEDLVTLTAKSEKVFAFKVGDNILDSSLAGDDLNQLVIELRQYEVAELVKTDDIVSVTIESVRPAEFAFHYDWNSSEVFTDVYYFLAFVLLVLGSLGYFVLVS